MKTMTIILGTIAVALLCLTTAAITLAVML